MSHIYISLPLEPPLFIPPLQFLTEHQAGLSVLYSIFLLVIYFTHDIECVCVYIYIFQYSQRILKKGRRIELSRGVRSSDDQGVRFVESEWKESAHSHLQAFRPPSSQTTWAPPSSPDLVGKSSWD